MPSIFAEAFWPESLTQVCGCFLIGGCFLFGGCWISYNREGFWSGLFACLLNIIGLGMFLLVMIAYNKNGAF